MVEDPVQLGEQRPRPDRALGNLHAEHALDGQHDAQLVGERRQPVVAVGEHDDLPVVARLEELLGAAVHVADDRLGVLDALTVEDEPQPEHAVRGGVLRADVQHHVGALAPRRRCRWSSPSWGQSCLPGPTPAAALRALTSAPARRPGAAASRSRRARRARSAPPPRPPPPAPHVRRRIGGGQGQRTGAPRTPPAPAAPPAGGEFGGRPVHGRRTRVQRHMRGQVAAAVRHRAHLPAVPEPGERAERRPGAAGRARSRRRPRARAPACARAAPRPRRGGGRSRPGSPGRAAATSAPATPRPRRSPARPSRSAPSGPHQDVPRDAVPVRLRDVHRHVVQPLVGEQQPADPRGRLGAPVDPGVQRPRAGGELHRVRDAPPAPPGPRPAPRSAAHRARPPHRPAPPRPIAQLLRGPGQQPATAPANSGRGVHGRTEVARRPLRAPDRAPVEAPVPVQSGLSRLPPPLPLRPSVWRQSPPWGVRSRDLDRPSG